ncbi:MAG: HNH endonuclease [Elusimicrobia bacterium]|nr:HNH endonuclease [Elusimicrobiota bacterium]
MDLSNLSDDMLLGKVEALAETERFSMVDFLIHLGELDQRTACQEKGYPSVFAYLTGRLGYSESDAIRRVRACRAARRFPSILSMMARGDLHLVAVATLAPLLTPENHERLLRRASRRSARELERMLIEISPAHAEPRDRIRLIPAPPSSPKPASGHPATGSALQPGPVLPLAPHEGGALVSIGSSPGPNPSQTLEPAPAVPPPERAEKRIVISFSADEQVAWWFEQARGLLRHRFPEGRMEDIIGEALRRLIEETLRSKAGLKKKPLKPAPAPATPPATGVPTARNRRIPAWVRRAAWERDGGRCAFVAHDGTRCGETSWLEYDHIVPWSVGGRSDDSANIRLLCRAHNQSEAARVLGMSGNDIGQAPYEKDRALARPVPDGLPPRRAGLADQ